MECRWLFPFTSGIDVCAIETVVRLAAARDATLVAVALVAAPLEQRSECSAGTTRLACIQEAQGFLAQVQSSARGHHVCVEGHNIFTGDVNRCIRMLVSDLRCDCLVAAMGGHQALFLSSEVLADLVVKPPAALVVARLPLFQPQKSLVQRLLSWRHQRSELQSLIGQEPSMRSEEAMPQHHLREHRLEASNLPL